MTSSYVMTRRVGGAASPDPPYRTGHQVLPAPPRPTAQEGNEEANGREEVECLFQVSGSCPTGATRTGGANSDPTGRLLSHVWQTRGSNQTPAPAVEESSEKSCDQGVFFVF